MTTTIKKKKNIMSQKKYDTLKRDATSSKTKVGKTIAATSKRVNKIKKININGKIIEL